MNLSLVRSRRPQRPEPTARLCLHPRVSAADQAPRGRAEVRHRCIQPEGDQSDPVLFTEVKRSRSCFDTLPAMTASDPCFPSVAEAALIKIGCAARLPARGAGSEQMHRGDRFTACGARFPRALGAIKAGSRDNYSWDSYT